MSAEIVQRKLVHLSFSSFLIGTTPDLHFVCFGPGACKRGEGADVIWPAPDQKALPVDLHPHFGGTEVLLHAGPGQRGLPHHDGAAGGDGIRHSRPKTAPV